MLRLAMFGHRWIHVRSDRMWLLHVYGWSPSWKTLIWSIAMGFSAGTFGSTKWDDLETMPFWANGFISHWLTNIINMLLYCYLHYTVDASGSHHLGSQHRRAKHSSVHWYRLILNLIQSLWGIKFQQERCKPKCLGLTIVRVKAWQHLAHGGVARMDQE